MSPPVKNQRILWWIYLVTLSASPLARVVAAQQQAAGNNNKQEDRAGQQHQGTILLLDEDNFTEAVQEHSDLLVLFYAPWCSVSRGFLKDFIKAAAILQKEKTAPVAAATVNMREEKRLVGRFNLPHFPIVRFYHNGKATRYPGGRGVRNLVKWVKSQQDKAMKAKHDKK